MIMLLIFHKLCILENNYFKLKVYLIKIEFINLCKIFSLPENNELDSQINFIKMCSNMITSSFC